MFFNALIIMLIFGFIMFITAFMWWLWKHYKHENECGNSDLKRQLFSLAIGNYPRFNGGVWKQIDENRELLELLINDVPELLKKKPWIIGWCYSRDRFLVSFAEITKTEKPVPNFPRPWPLGEIKGAEPCSTP